MTISLPLCAVYLSFCTLSCRWRSWFPTTASHQSRRGWQWPWWCPVTCFHPPSTCLPTARSTNSAPLELWSMTWLWGMATDRSGMQREKHGFSMWNEMEKESVCEGVNKRVNEWVRVCVCACLRACVHAWMCVCAPLCVFVLVTVTVHSVTWCCRNLDLLYVFMCAHIR